MEPSTSAKTSVSCCQAGAAASVPPTHQAAQRPTDEHSAPCLLRTLYAEREQISRRKCGFVLLRRGLGLQRGEPGGEGMLKTDREGSVLSGWGTSQVQKASLHSTGGNDTHETGVRNWGLFLLWLCPWSPPGQPNLQFFHFSLPLSFNLFSFPFLPLRPDFLPSPLLFPTSLHPFLLLSFSKL